ncbi:MAG: serine hydrolase [Leucobacter sp.]
MEQETDTPDFGLDTEAGGIYAEQSDGVPMISYALLDSNGTVLRQYDAERIYYSASTVKVGVLVAMLREVQSGKIHLDDEITVTHEFTSMDPHAARFVIEEEETDPSLGKVGDVVTRAWVLNRMTTVSANCATNICFEELGAEKIAAVFADAGARESGLGRPYSDAAGESAGVTNTASALGLARLMAALVRGDLLDPEWTAYAMQLLHDREDPVISTVANELASKRGESVYTGGKGGSVDGIKHDFAFVQRGNDTLCLAVCTRAYTIPQGAAAISAIAHALLEEAYSSAQ